MGAQVGGIAHLYNHAERAVGLATAVVCVQALTVMSITGRIIGGWVVTRVKIRTFTLLNVVLQALGTLLLATADVPWQFITGAIVFGGSIGNLLMLQPLWLAEAFGVTAYARLFSLANAITLVGVASGPLSMGAMFDWGDYSSAYLLATAVSVASLVVMSTAGAAPERT